MKPKILVYSASEDAKVALAIQANLQDSADIRVWNQDTFPLSETMVDGLTKHARIYDFGIFVLTPHDRVSIRDEEFAAPRDNVLFELGIFVGRMEKIRSIVVLPDEKADPPTRIPSDLKGWVVCRYDPSLPNLRAALGPTCSHIQAHIDNLGRRRSEVHVVNKKSGKCLDVSGGSKSDGTVIIQHEYHGRSHQRWSLSKVEGKYVEIVARHSGKRLDVRDRSTDAGAVVQQHSRNEGHNQHWQLEAQDDGSYLIIARQSELYLAVAGGSNENGATIIQDNGWDDDRFKWWVNTEADVEDLFLE